MPVSRVADFIAEAGAALAARFPGVRIDAFGHVGDGNIHYDVLSAPGGDQPGPPAAARDEGAARIVHDIVASLGGSISAEQAPGKLQRRRPKVALRYKSPEEVAAQRAIRAALDPKRIADPRGAILMRACGAPGRSTSRGRRMLSVVEVLTADQAGFVTRPVEQARLAFGGIVGDRHFGLTRPSCARTPWHARDTVIANTRQVSILSVEECAEIAGRLAIARVEPRLIGANLVLEGEPDLTGLAPATRFVFPSGAVLFVTEENHPCRHAGKVLAEAFDESRLELEFVRAAQGRRGLIALVEGEGDVAAGDGVKVVAPRLRRTVQTGPE